ncbi:hypothetical protein MRB53_002600 [Persea americana]|uniref:Uncharacterized protein n=1 Tax=Persea americana TaxID=3435 RepID=A0ACC2MXB8_PERAE|nr:hypothetical protein MRB53_002600 [Persea americana]WJJ45877.1 WRKY26 [Persea americana]
MADWDLQAVVRGCRSSNLSSSAPPKTTTTTGAGTEIDPLAFFTQTLLQEEEEDDHLSYFPDLIATQTCMQELEELCRPFYHKTPQPISPKTHSIISNPPISAFNEQQQQHQQQQQKKTAHSSSNTQISRSKRRKNQQKRVVREVPAEGLSSDVWAWRKYGQKPIKGSPYPRGYYRCSSSKGCLARKQVERSRADPTMFIITYTAEHNHPVPTHRNSLAGSTRNKCSTDQSIKPPTSSGLSPTTPLTASMEEDILGHKQEEPGEVKLDEDRDHELSTQMSDDMFFDLEELRESTSTSGSFDDCLSDHFSPWGSSFASTAASVGL